MNKLTRGKTHLQREGARWCRGEHWTHRSNSSSAVDLLMDDEKILQGKIN